MEEADFNCANYEKTSLRRAILVSRMNKNFSIDQTHRLNGIGYSDFQFRGRFDLGEGQ